VGGHDAHLRHYLLGPRKKKEEALARQNEPRGRGPERPGRRVSRASSCREELLRVRGKLPTEAYCLISSIKQVSGAGKKIGRSAVAKEVSKDKKKGEGGPTPGRRSRETGVAGFEGPDRDVLYARKEKKSRGHRGGARGKSREKKTRNTKRSTLPRTLVNVAWEGGRSDGKRF